MVRSGKGFEFYLQNFQLKKCRSGFEPTTSRSNAVILEIRKQVDFSLYLAKNFF